jgi:hypothetical protein
MAALFAFKCTCCGEVHEGSPSFAFEAPDPYAGLSEAQKTELAQLSSDFCIIQRGEETDHFIRAVLEVPIHGVDDPFLWGVWVSLSKKSFDRYSETYENPIGGEGFFAWVCNEISVYPYSASRPADVILQTGQQRPKVLLHRGDPEDDPLVLDQTAGISVARAQALAEQALHAAGLQD